MDSQASGSVKQAGVGVGVGVGVDVVVDSAQYGMPVTVPVPDVMPKAISRHSTMLTPVVLPVMSPVDRHVAALPAAKGPRATAQTATSATSSRPLAFARSVQASGRVVIQRSSKASRTQLKILKPEEPMTGVVARQEATLPTA